MEQDHVCLVQFIDALDLFTVHVLVQHGIEVGHLEEDGLNAFDILDGGRRRQVMVLLQ